MTSNMNNLHRMYLTFPMANHETNYSVKQYDNATDMPNNIKLLIDDYTQLAHLIQEIPHMKPNPTTTMSKLPTITNISVIWKNGKNKAIYHPTTHGNIMTTIDDNY